MDDDDPDGDAQQDLDHRRAITVHLVHTARLSQQEPLDVAIDFIMDVTNTMRSFEIALIRETQMRKNVTDELNALKGIPSTITEEDIINEHYQHSDRYELPGYGASIFANDEDNPLYQK